MFFIRFHVARFLVISNNFGNQVQFVSSDTIIFNIKSRGWFFTTFIQKDFRFSLRHDTECKVQTTYHIGIAEKYLECTGQMEIKKPHGKVDIFVQHWESSKRSGVHTSISRKRWKYPLVWLFLFCVYSINSDFNSLHNILFRLPWRISNVPA